MRIPSGSSDRYLNFVAVDPTDLKTRETGLTGFTVYRARDGGAATLWTTPTVVEYSAANMPGVYGLLIDEDTTIGAAHDTEEMLVHVTHASMQPVTRAFELYRPKGTEGRTLSLETDGMGHADLKEWLGVAPLALASQRVQALAAAISAGAIDAAAIATDAIDGDAIAATAVSEIQSGLATAAALATVQADTDDIQTRLPAALVSGRMDASVGAMANDVITAAAIAAGALAEITTDVLTGEALTELPQAKPPATPTLAEAIMLLYMAARNLIEVDASEKRIANDAGTVIVKKPLSDSGTVYQEAEMVAGP